MARVYLVHGTWANGPFRNVKDDDPDNWFHPNNNMAQIINKKFGRDIDIRSFVWSGKNSVSSRSIAADELSQRIQKDQNNLQVNQIFFVAHSHGGTVVSECLSKHWDVWKSKDISCGGVICLATPFIYHEKRHDAERKNRLLLIFSIFFILITTLLYSNGCNFTTLPSCKIFTQLDILFYLRFFSLFFLSSGIALLLLGLFSKSKHSNMVSLFNDSEDFPPFYLLRAAKDEASGLIGFSSFLSWLMLKMYFLVEPLLKVVKVDKQSNSGFIGIEVKLTQIIFFGGIIGTVYYFNGLYDHKVFLVLASILLGVLAIVSIFFYVLHMIICGELSLRNWLHYDIEMEQSIPNMKTNFELVRHENQKTSMRHGLHSWPTIQKRISEILFDLVNNNK